jgi:hypothetical protein
MPLHKMATHSAVGFRRPLSLLFAGILGTATVAAADLGVLAGAGSMTASGGALASGQIGAEACLRCSGSVGLFVEYTHWFTSGPKLGYNPSDQVRRADLAGAGLRIQWASKVRPFLDLGIVGGTDAHHQAGSGGAVAGGVIGAGVRIRLTPGWYIRPQVRVYGLSPHSLEGLSPHWAVSGLVGIGYSW